MIKIQPDDVVFHRPTRETWCVQGISGDRLTPAGWPPCQAKVSDCLLVERGRFHTIPAPGQRYRHQKNAVYEVVGIATHTETNEPMVVYKPAYGAGGRNATRPLSVFMWTRPLSMFMDGRFTLVSQS